MLKLVLQIKDLKTIAARYFLYGFGIIDILLLPKLLDETTYSDFEYFKNLVYLFPNILLGASSGYIFEYYTEKKNEYKHFFTASMVVTFLTALVACIAFKSFFLIVPLIAINLYTVIEQHLKISRNFILAFLFKPLISIFTIINCFLIYKYGLKTEAKELLFYSFTLAITIWCIFLINKNAAQISSQLRESFVSFWGLIKKSYSITLGSLILSVLFFSERFFVEKYYEASLPAYSFAFNLSQIAVILFSVINYIKTIDIGENIDNISKQELRSSFSTVLKVYLLFFILFIAGVVVLSKFYDFNSLIVITLIISYAKGFNTVVGTISPIAMFKKYNLEMLKTIFVIFLCDVLLSFALGYNNAPLIYVLVFNSVFILIYSLYIVDIVFRRIQYSNLKLQA